LAADSRTLDPSGTSGADYWFTSKTNTYAPSIASQSAGVTNSTSGGFTVSVTASGTAPLSYQWATNNSPVAGATSSSYGSMPATTNQSGSYSCVITNLYGAITSTAVNVLITNVVVNTNGSLVVNGGFETGDFTGWTFVGSSSDNNVSSAAKDVHSGTYGANLGAVTSLGYLSQTLATTNGQTYLLSLWLNSPDGLTPNEFQVSWNGSVIFDQANIPNIGWTNLQFTVQATGSSTVLQFGFRDDPTAFGFDDISVTATNSAPVITSQPKDQTVRVGTPATFSVTAVGTSLTYDWRWHGTNVGSGSSVSVTPSTTNENGTVVYVNIGSAYGGVVSTNANLYVTNGALPVIVTQPVSKSVTVGNSATFTVSATGATSYQWTMDGTNVATGSSWVTGTGYPVGTNNVQATAINTYGSTLSVIVTFARTNTPTPPTPSTNIYMIHLGQAKLGRAILSQ